METMARTRSSGFDHRDLGWHRLCGALVGIQAGLVLATAPFYARMGVQVHWATALPMAGVCGFMIVGWAYYATSRTTPVERRMAEALLLFALLSTLSLIFPPAQYLALALRRPLIDATLYRADRLLGVDVQACAAWTWQHPAIHELLVRAYFTLRWQWLLIVPALAVLNQRKALWEYAFHFHVCLVITLVCFALFPAASAFQYLGFESAVSQGTFITHFEGGRAGTLGPLDFGAMEGLISMPSFHVAGALMVTWAVRRTWLLWPLIVVNTLLSASTFLTGAHYMVDTIGAFVMVVGSGYLWRRWGARLLDKPARRIAALAAAA